MSNEVIETSQIPVIQRFVDANKYKSYLEIGLDIGVTFLNIQNIESRYGVEPFLQPMFVMNLLVYEKTFMLKQEPMPTMAVYAKTSDDFFTIGNSLNYDIIFIDGLHTREQAYKDIENSLKHLSPNGTILVHDTNPANKLVANVGKPVIPQWSGDVWKGIVELRTNRDDVDVFTLDIPYGMTVIKPNSNGQKNPLLDKKYLDYTYDDFAKERKELLNIKPLTYLDELYGKN